MPFAMAQGDGRSNAWPDAAFHRMFRAADQQGTGPGKPMAIAIAGAGARADVTFRTGRGRPVFATAVLCGIQPYLCRLSRLRKKCL